MSKSKREKIKSRNDLKRERRKMKNKREKRLERERKKEEKRARKEEEKQGEKQEKKIVKIWKDWVPKPKPEVENLIRIRMQDCNWVDFEDTGHSDNFTLIPRSNFGEIGEIYTAGAEDIVSIVGSAPNPFNITAEDEDTEFQEEQEDQQSGSQSLESLELQFDSVDAALYNLRDDPQERVDLKLLKPQIYNQLRSRVLYHLSNISPEDFPEQDLAGHPRNFDGAFSPGWCTPK